MRRATQLPSTIQSPPSSSSPNDWFNMILTQLNKWLSIIPNFFQSLFSKLGEIFSGENLSRWLAVAQPYLLTGLGVVLLCLFCCCLLPAILSCIAWLTVVIWSFIAGFFLLLWRLITGFFMLLWNICRSVFGLCCSCCRGSARMMKAPGRGGKVCMPRASFEANPRSYFRNLRAARPVNSYNLLK